MNSDDIADLIHSLLSLPDETEWVEFKHNNAEPEKIGENISALANSATLHRKDAGYIVWGVDDATHDIVGTNFQPRRKQHKDQDMENWLRSQLRPSADFSIFHPTIDGKPIVLVKIQPASHAPVRFGEHAYVRINSSTQKLLKHPEKERQLWSLFDRHPFEEQAALAGVTADDVLERLDYTSYFRRTGQPPSDNRKGILERLADDRLIISKGRGRYDIANAGAILFAHDLRDFGRLARKALRIIKYKGTGRIRGEREWSDRTSRSGYASAFEPAIAYINSQLPEDEHIGPVFRAEVRMYPEEAIRELVPNALMHQDFAMTGVGPMVEIFDDRIEITNPGEPLVDTDHFIDAAPRSRNEMLASLMRRMNMCEERGSGIDKVIHYVEMSQLPAPDFSVHDRFTKVVLFAHKKLSEMDSKERIRACYQHACLRYVQFRRMTNSSLRARFGIEAKNSSQVSRYINEALEAGAIRLFDPSVGNRDRSYIPFWASTPI